MSLLTNNLSAEKPDQSSSLVQTNQSAADYVLRDMVRVWFDGGRQWHMIGPVLKSLYHPLDVKGFQHSMDRLMSLIFRSVRRPLYIRKPGAAGMGLDETLLVQAAKYWINGDRAAMTVILKAFDIPVGLYTDYLKDSFPHSTI